MGLKINGSSSGSVELDVPADIGSDLNITIPGAAGTLDRLERAGNILQVVTASTSTEVSHNTASMVDTGLSVSITPSSTTSKILIFVSQPYRNARDNTSGYASFILLRGSTQLTTSPQSGGGGFLLGYTSAGVTTVDIRGVWSVTCLDSPATTSQVTYKTQMAVNSATNSAFVEAQENGTTDSATSFITVMEVAG
jgi:hypothetical protein